MPAYRIGLAPLLLAPLFGLGGFCPVHANDGFGGLSATGLSFEHTDAVAMIEEDLSISPDRITVDYLFRNLTGADVTGEVIFPMPPVALADLWQGMVNMPEAPIPENLVGFTATVAGQPVTVTIDTIAVQEPPWEDDRPASAAYDTPGTDITARLQALGIPVGFDFDAITAAMRALPEAERERLVADGLAEFWEWQGDDGKTESEAVPLWSVLQRHHWTQTFPAGADLRISHGYANLPPGGVFAWTHPPEEDWLQDYARRYCIDDATSAGLAKALGTPGEQDFAYGTAFFTSYVLRTANSWAGPIERFRLTLDKGAAENILSLCFEGDLKKTGPTTWTAEIRDFRPERDLEILTVWIDRPEIGEDGEE